MPRLGFGLGLSRFRSGGGSAPAPTAPILDTVTGAGAAYSTRKLRTAYAGSAIRVRESGGNTEADIGFDSNGDLDTAALLSHCGSNSGFVVTWYDQSGNSRNVTQATTTRQPRIVNAGALETFNSKPAVWWDGTDDILANTSPFLYAAGAATIFLVHSLAGSGASNTVFEGRSTSATPRYQIRRGTAGVIWHNVVNDAGTILLNNAPLTTAAAYDGTARIMALRDSGSQSQGFINGVLGLEPTYTRSGAMTLDRFALNGADTNGTQNGGPAGHIAEAIFFTSALSNADFNTVGASQGEEYGITVTPFLEGEELEFFGRTLEGSFAEFNTDWEGYTGTFDKLPDGRSPGSVDAPYTMRHYFATTSGAANRAHAAAATLNGSSSYALPFFQGALARVYRVTNGVMSVVRESEVTGGKIGAWGWLRPDGDKIVDALSYTVALDSWVRPSVPYYFRVAAVGADGLAGTWSAPISFTPANTTGTPSGTVNPTKAINKTGEGGALAAPGNVAATAGVIAREAVITWDAVSGAEGYVVERSYYDPAEIDANPYLELASHAEPILAGDLIILSKEYLTQDDSLFSSRAYNAESGFNGPATILFGKDATLKRDGNSWAYVPYSGDRPTGVFNNYFVRRTAAAGNTTQFQRYWHSGTDQTFYKVLQEGVTYRLRVIMRVSEARTVSFLPGGPNLSNTTFSVGTTFAEYTYDMTPTSTLTGASPYDWRLQFTAGASPVDLDVAHFEIVEVGASANPLASSPPASGSYLRDHRFIKPGLNNRSMADLLTIGYKQFYDACVLNNCNPWIQLEWGTPKDDILNLVAFLAAPNAEDHPMVDLRLSMGIPEPWVNTFDDIKYEGGNEAWNPLASFWITPSMTDSATATAYSNGNVAGLLWQMTSDWMKESPYWSALSSKITHHAGGWAINNFGEQAYTYFPDAKEVSVAAYNGGWDNGTSLVSEGGLSFAGVLADPIVIQKPRAISRVNALKSTCTSLGRTYGTDIRYTIYEAGPGYQLNGLNGASVTAAQVIEQEIVMKSRAAGAATVDSMLTYAQQDFKGFNFFVVRTGDYWSSHGEITNGDQEYIVHALPRIIHEQIAPAKVYGSPTSSIGTITVTRQGGGTADINQIGAYQLKNLTDPSKRMLVLINRALDPSQLETDDPLYSATPSGDKLFTIQTNWNSATSLKAWTAGIGPFRQHNRYPVGQRRVSGGGLTADPLCVQFDYSPTTLSLPPDLQNITIDDSVGATADGLPAGNCLILLFEGVT